jgi:hypothetical protein
MDFGTGNTEICKLSTLILYSLHKIHKESYQGKGVLSSHGEVCIEMCLRYISLSLHRLSCTRTFIFPFGRPRISIVYKGNLPDHPSKHESYSGKWAEKEEWTRELAAKVTWRLIDDEVSDWLMEVTLTRHCDKPLGVVAEGVRHICRKRKGGRIELWA